VTDVDAMEKRNYVGMMEKIKTYYVAGRSSKQLIYDRAFLPFFDLMMVRS
jgi:hypothetical protein